MQNTNCGERHPPAIVVQSMKAGLRISPREKRQLSAAALCVNKRWLRLIQVGYNSASKEIAATYQHNDSPCEYYYNCTHTL